MDTERNEWSTRTDGTHWPDGHKWFSEVPPDLQERPEPTGASPFSLNGTSAYYSDGNVGIGTANPGQELSVAGTIEGTSGGF